MASNSELIADIKKLDENAQTDGLNNEKLAELRKALKEKHDAGPETDEQRAEREAAARKAKDEADAEAAEGRQKLLAEKRKKAASKLPELKKGEHRVAKGRAVTTKKGVKAYPAGVAASDLSGGEKAFRDLLDRDILEG